jgi:N-acetylmuramoyl-L-alanine amidase
MKGFNMSVKLFHDPGHGGDNPGAAVGGVIEKHLNLSISRDIEAFLDGWPFLSQTQSRANDDSINYEMRGQKAKAWGADLVLAYHCNTFTANPEVSGLTTYVRPNDPIAYEVALQINRAAPSGLRYAKQIPFVTEKLQDPKNAWLKNAEFILRQYAPTPAVLVEFGYLTNSCDRAYLQDLVQRPAIATAILSGVARYISMKHSTPIMECPHA